MHDASPRQRQTRAPQAPQAPQTPTAPKVPRTPEELEALANKRSELKQQLESVTDRREELADQLEDADPAARPGLETRIQMLDERSARLEREILQADEAIAVAVAGGVGQGPREEETTEEPSTDDVVSKDVLANAMLAEALAFVLLGACLSIAGCGGGRATGSRAAAPTTRGVWISCRIPLMRSRLKWSGSQRANGT